MVNSRLYRVPVVVLHIAVAGSTSLAVKLGIQCSLQVVNQNSARRHHEKCEEKHSAIQQESKTFQGLPSIWAAQIVKGKVGRLEIRYISIKFPPPASTLPQKGPGSNRLLPISSCLTSILTNLQGGNSLVSEKWQC